MSVSTDWSGLDEVIAKAEAGGACTLGVAIRGPSGESFSHNGERRFGAASVVKIGIMAELFRQIDSGSRSIDDPFTLTEKARAPGSGIILHLHEGIVLSVGDLAYLMMSISDNTATNVLIDMLGMDAINASMRRLGMASSNLGRKMQGRPAKPGDQENWATPDDYAAAISAILGGTAASPASSEKMIALLEGQQNDRRIARYLPKADRPRWGSKTGTLTGIVNDVGFVMGAKGPAVIAVFCENPPDTHEGEAAIGNVSRAALVALGAQTG